MVEGGSLVEPELHTLAQPQSEHLLWYVVNAKVCDLGEPAGPVEQDRLDKVLHHEHPE